VGQTYAVTDVAGTTYTWTYSGTGWSQTGGGTTHSITASATGSGTVTVTPSNSCGSGTARTLAITVNAPPTTATNGSTQTISSTGSATLSGNNPSVGTGAWTVVSGPSTSSSQFANTTVYNTTFTPAGGAGSYVVRWTISNSPCTSSTADATITVTALPAGAILLYQSSGYYQGNLGGRSGADAKCISSMPTGCGNARAFISVSAADEIRDMPSNYSFATNKPIYWWNFSTGSGTIMANNWADMLDGSILSTYQSGTGSGQYAWTGSYATGALWPDDTYHTFSCFGWTSSDPGTGIYMYMGASVVVTQASGEWLGLNEPRCNISCPIVCICTLP
jgi:hypothetical protein